MYNTGCRKYSADLAQGGLKVPCSLLYKAMLMEPADSNTTPHGHVTIT